MKRMFLIAVVVFAAVLTASAQVTFTSARDYPLNAAPYATAIGDLNGDGKPDLAALSVLGGTVSILLNNGDGTFSSATDFPAIAPDQTQPFSGIALSDLNGDSKLDVIVYQSGAINVLLGNGDGTLQKPATTILDVYARSFLGAGDFNGDGKADVAIIGADIGALAPILFLGNGDGTFVRGSDSTSDAGENMGVIADVNHDGKLDIVTSHGGVTDVSLLSVYLGNGNGTLHNPTTNSSDFPYMSSLLSGDFNHDGVPDLVSTHYQSYYCEFFVCRPVGAPGSVAMMLGNKNGTFAGGPIANADFASSSVGDFDGDGNLDIAATEITTRSGLGTSGMVDFYLGNGRDWAFDGPTKIAFGNDRYYSFASNNAGASADLNGDGLADIVLVSSSLQVALNTTPTFSLTASAPPPPIHAGSTATYTIGMSPTNGFSNAITLTCAVPSSAGIHCSISPSSLSHGGSSTLTVTTTAGSVALMHRRIHSHSDLLYALWLPFGAVTFGGIGIGSTQRRKKFAIAILMSMVGAGLIFQLACGGASPPTGGTPAGTYTVTVQGKSGSMQRSASVQLTVQ